MQFTGDTHDSTAPVLMRPADRLLIWLVFLLTCVSFIATLPQTLHLLNYTGTVDLSRDGLGFRWLREATLTVIVVISTVLVAARRATIQGGTAAVLFLILSWLLVVAFWSVTIKHVPPQVAALGVRLLQYTPLVFLGYMLTRAAGHAPLALFARLLRCYVLIQACAAIYQIFGGTRELWYKTLFGHRAFGTFASYNAFGPTMAACTLVFCIAALWSARIGADTRRYNLWILLTGVLAITSGSRTAILLACFVVAYYYFAAMPFGVALKRVLLTLTPLVGLGLYYFANESVITGRRTTSPTFQNEARFTIWTEQLAEFETTGEIIFGIGLGEGTTAAAWLMDSRPPGDAARSPHSTYLSLAVNYGFVGLLAYLAALALTLTRAPPVLAGAFVAMLAGLSIPMSFLEVFPVNAILFFLWGCILGSNHWWCYQATARQDRGQPARTKGLTPLVQQNARPA